MPQPHDVGGHPDAGPIDRAEHQLADWEILADAVSQALDRRGVWNTDAHRRIREQIPTDRYADLSYYERWIYAIENGLIELGVVSKKEIDDRLRDLETRWVEP